MRNQKSSKDSLFLMELALAILLFAICSAVCLKLFVAARETADKSRELSFAVLSAQSVAECYKAAEGDMEELSGMLSGSVSEKSVSVYYDRRWQISSWEDCCYVLELSENSNVADIIVKNVENGNEIYRISTAISAGGAV